MVNKINVIQQKTRHVRCRSVSSCDVGTGAERRTEVSKWNSRWYAVIFLSLCMAGPSLAQTNILFCGRPRTLKDLSKYIPAIEAASKTHEQDIVPLLYLLYYYPATDSSNLYNFSEYHSALFRGMVEVGGDQGRLCLRRIAQELIGFGKQECGRHQHVRAKYILMQLGSIADKDTGEWALQVFKDKTVKSLEVRQGAYDCYLGSVLLALTNVEDRVALILKDYRTPGPDASAARILRARYFDMNLDDAVIRDGAFSRHLVKIGEPAIPQLMEAWKKLMARETRNESDYLYQYALAQCINDILAGMRTKSFDLLPFGPAQLSEEDYNRIMHEWDAELEKQSDKGGEAKH